MQKEEMQYRLAILISSRAQSNREHIREIVQESGSLLTSTSAALNWHLEFQKIEQNQTLINYIGDIIKKRRKEKLPSVFFDSWMLIKNFQKFC